MKGIYAQLDKDEKGALLDLAWKEKRDPRQQAALLIRLQLERLGLLPASPVSTIPEPKESTLEHA